MKILVFSDSHGMISPMAAAVRLEQPELVLHLGDHDRDLTELKRSFPELDCRGVSGNCDPRSGREELRIDAEGVPLLLVHGHRQRVKQTLTPLYLKALEVGVRCVLFGHTHIPLLQREGDLTLLNPGSIGFGLPPTYGVLLAQSGSLECSLREARFPEA
jgi:putative phosphoesterase